MFSHVYVTRSPVLRKGLICWLKLCSASYGWLPMVLGCCQNHHFFSIINGLGLNIFLGLLPDCTRFELTVLIQTDGDSIGGFLVSLIGIYLIIQNHTQKSFWDTPLSTLDYELSCYGTMPLRFLGAFLFRWECLWVIPLNSQKLFAVAEDLVGRPLRILETLLYRYCLGKQSFKSF